LLLRLQLNEQTLAALPAADPDSTIAALPAALQPTSTALPAVLTVYKGELCSLEYDPAAGTVLLPKPTRHRRYACDTDYYRADKPATQTRLGRALLPSYTQLDRA
jgi:hypothetical protein